MSTHESADLEKKENDDAPVAAESSMWIIYSIISFVSIGLTNFIIGDLSRALGVPGAFPLCLGITLMWVSSQLYSSLCSKPSPDPEDEPLLALA